MPATPFASACAALESALAGPARQAIVNDLASSPTLGRALQRLRDGMRAHLLTGGHQRIDLRGVVKAFDAQTRAEGFHVLHDWDGKAEQVNADSIPVDVLHFVADARGDEPADRTVLAVLLDYYYVHILALLAMRVWDAGDANENLARVTTLLETLQGPGGSRQLFARHAETLILLATSHYEAQEIGYDTLLHRVRSLDRRHQVNIALGHASSMGCHLRFGFEATYARDTVKMRDDNIADYPWLCFAAARVMEEYERLHAAGTDGVELEPVIEALLNALSGDARALIGVPPSSLAAWETERCAFRDRFYAYRDELAQRFEAYRPTERDYSPLSFFFNFSHNVLKGTVVDALLWSEPWALTFDDLLTALPRDAGTNAGRLKLATTLMNYARAHPDRIRGQLMPVIVYDPEAGRRAFATTMRKIRDV